MTAPLDLQGVACPLNLVKVRLALEPMAPGEVLTVLLDPGEATDNVPRAVARAGHAVLETAAGTPTRVVIRKGGP